MEAINKNWPALACAAAMAMLSACAVPVTEFSPVSRVASSFDTGKGYQATVGDIVIDHYEGAWLLRLTNPVSIEIAGSEPVPAGSQLIPRYTHDASGKLIVVSDSYDPDIGIICATDNEGFVADSAIQVDGAKQGRTWSLTRPVPLVRSGFIRSDEFPTQQQGWKLQYVGKLGSTLRFTIEELGLDRQRMGQVEYTHDIDSGKEFVFRGTRIRIDQIDQDGTLHYTIIDGIQAARVE